MSSKFIRVFANVILWIAQVLLLISLNPFCRVSYNFKDIMQVEFTLNWIIISWMLYEILRWGCRFVDSSVIINIPWFYLITLTESFSQVLPYIAYYFTLKRGCMFRYITLSSSGVCVSLQTNTGALQIFLHFFKIVKHLRTKLTVIALSVWSVCECVWECVSVWSHFS
jgi:hypothetical protein